MDEDKNVDPKEIEESFHSMFKQFDMDNSGGIDKAEMKEFLRGILEKSGQKNNNV